MSKALQRLKYSAKIWLIVSYSTKPCQLAPKKLRDG
jgi:hypothetical protein